MASIGGHDADRDVDEEDPVPVDRLGEHAAGQQADRCRPRTRRSRRRRSPSPAPRLGEHRDDHPEDDRRGHRAADALDESGRDQHLLALGDAAQQRGDVEDAEPGEEHAAAGDQVAEPAGEQQQAAERDQVRVDDPGEARLGEAEVAWIDGSATFTTVASSTIISMPTQSTTSAIQRERSSACQRSPRSRSPWGAGSVTSGPSHVWDRLRCQQDRLSRLPRTHRSAPAGWASREEQHAAAGPVRCLETTRQKAADCPGRYLPPGRDRANGGACRRHCSGGHALSARCTTPRTLQETLLRVVPTGPRALRGFEGRCLARAPGCTRSPPTPGLNALAEAPKRRAAAGYGPATDLHDGPGEPTGRESVWLEPVPDATLGRTARGPTPRYEQRESVELAFIAALQHLPPTSARC